MGDWNDIFRQMQNAKSQYDIIRLGFLTKLSSLTNRNVITYYSAWLNRDCANNTDMYINDNDMEGFMTCIHEMECNNGLDLILHTPGGDPMAAEAIVNYFRTKFNNDIRIIVPQLAMSAGTMIAFSGKEIVMGKQSSLGPIDPQFNGIPAYNIKLEFEEAKKDLASNPHNAQYWAIKLQQYPAAFMKTVLDSIELSEILAKEWLGTCMFDYHIASNIDVINNIVSTFSDHQISKSHNRHFNASFCKNAGLKIHMMEDDQVLQDKILSLHHAYIISLDVTDAVKIIECQNGKSRISFSRR